MIFWVVNRYGLDPVAGPFATLGDAVRACDTIGADRVEVLTVGDRATSEELGNATTPGLQSGHRPA